MFYIFLLSGLIILGVLFYHNNKAFDNTAALVTHTYTVIDRTNTILFLTQNLQWEARNYALTGDSNAYRKYFPIRDLIQSNEKYLLQLVSDNKYQRANALKLQQQINQLIQFTDSSLHIKQTSKDAIDHFITSVKQHVTFHDAINQQTQLIKTEENRLLAVRSDDVYKTIDTTYRIFIASGILILFLLMGTFVFVFYHFKKRHKAEKRLMESEHRFHVLLNSTKDLAIFMIDEKGCILNWYEGAHNIKGYNKEEVIGKNISIFYTPESIKEGEPAHNLEVAAQHGSFETEGWRVRKNGSRFWADVLITAVYDEDGKVQGFTKVTRDFSLNKRAQDEIKNALQKEKELNEMKSNFVSMASHEFRTPLSTILSSVSLMEHYRTTETQDKRDKHIQRIKSSVSEMVSILEEFLSLEKIEEGKVEINNEMFYLEELVEIVCSKFNNVLKAGQQIQRFHQGEKEVLLDKNFTDHIVTNLISNAVKYSPAGTNVTVKTSVDNNNIRVVVKDEGIGISKEDQEHLFERFFRASNTGSIKGTGLGLHIVKRYIDMMDGTISIESKVGEGCTFTVTMPVVI
jgi:PAS domain S-box-containing protein